MYLTSVLSTYSNGIQINNNQKGRCAVCGQIKKSTLYKQMPAIFTSDQTGGASCVPYMTNLDLYLCDECHTQMLEDAKFFEIMQTRNIIHFRGCMGQNTVYKKPLR